jgi:hypothetical protein
VAVIRVGILLKHAENVRLALINGVGHPVYRAAAGQNTMIGMSAKAIKFSGIYLKNNQINYRVAIL